MTFKGQKSESKFLSLCLIPYIVKDHYFYLILTYDTTKGVVEGPKF